jgi:hypothetical protein
VKLFMAACNSFFDFGLNLGDQGGLSEKRSVEVNS